MTVKGNAQITLTDVTDIKATTTYYKLQDSSLAPPAAPTLNPPDGWSTTEPTYEGGNTDRLYLVTQTLWSNDTFDYSDVSLSSSYEAAKAAYTKAQGAQNTADSANDTANHAQDKAAAAQQTADGKNTVYYSAAAPEGNLITNDLWIDTAHGNTLYVYQNGSWTVTKLGHEAIQSIDAGTITVGKITSNQIDASNLKVQQIYNRDSNCRAQIGTVTYTDSNHQTKTGSGIQLYVNDQYVGALVAEILIFGAMFNLTLVSQSGKSCVQLASLYDGSGNFVNDTISISAEDQSRNLQSIHVGKDLNDAGIVITAGDQRYSNLQSVRVAGPGSNNPGIYITSSNNNIQCIDGQTDDGDSSQHWHKFSNGILHQWGRVNSTCSATSAYGSVYLKPNCGIWLPLKFECSKSKPTIMLNLVSPGILTAVNAQEANDGVSVDFTISSPTRVSNLSYTAYYDAWGYWK